MKTRRCFCRKVTNSSSSSPRRTSRTFSSPHSNISSSHLRKSRGFSLSLRQVSTSNRKAICLGEARDSRARASLSPISLTV